jgi:proteasome accessory factor C
MDEAKKILRVFQLIVRLRGALGCSKTEIAEDFGVSVRTIERYICLLKDLGFEITGSNGRYRIESIERRALKHEEAIGFSLEEATAIRDALLACTPKGAMRRGLMDKLYALTELEELSEVVFKQSISRNITLLREAIRNEQQLLLKGYQAADSGSSKDYYVEPMRLCKYFGYLMAFDVKAQKVKQFKTERISEVLPTGKSWVFRAQHHLLGVDPFGMTGTEPIRVHLRLSKRARLLLEEEFPEASPQITSSDGVDYYNGEVYSLNGIGRFVMGLLDEITILEPESLATYIRKKIYTFQPPTPIVGKGL